MKQQVLDILYKKLKCLAKYEKDNWKDANIVNEASFAYAQIKEVINKIELL